MFAVTCAMVLSLGTVKTFAQKIGVVDGNAVLTNFDDYKKANEKLNAQAKVWQDSLTMMAKATQDKFDGYSKIASTMSEDAKQKAQAEVNQMKQNLDAYNNAKFNQQDGEIMKMRADLLKPILDKIKKAVEGAAKKKKVEVVIDKGQIVYVADGVTDLTEDVQKALK
ncbi:MAG: OmpH family outer membrane protein [Bacteroidetes bacterium]|nr:OmpH family outer membrane protein [Bacteroidota bacterium]